MVSKSLARAYAAFDERQDWAVPESADLHATGGEESAERKPECFCKPMVVGMTGWKEEVLG
jgi:hypothetical protein